MTTNGSEKFFEWASTYNVLDKYKKMSTEQIKEDVKKNTLPFAVLMSQLVGDFNFASVIRSANAFGARDVFYYGKKKFDRRGTCGVMNYTDVSFLPEFEQVLALKEKYTFVAMENNVDYPIVNLKSFDWDLCEKDPMIILGEEGSGIEKRLLDVCDYWVEVPIRGSVRSINAACAASVIMYDLTSMIGV